MNENWEKDSPVAPQAPLWRACAEAGLPYREDLQNLARLSSAAHRPETNDYVTISCGLDIPALSFAGVGLWNFRFSQSWYRGNVSGDGAREDWADITLLANVSSESAGPWGPRQGVEVALKEIEEIWHACFGPPAKFGSRSVWSFGNASLEILVQNGHVIATICLRWRRPVPETLVTCFRDPEHLFGGEDLEALGLGVPRYACQPHQNMPPVGTWLSRDGTFVILVPKRGDYVHIARASEFLRVKCTYMWPAKGGGFCEISLENDTPYRFTLLARRPPQDHDVSQYDAAGAALARRLGIAFRTNSNNVAYDC
ncbi:hypothetical protein [Celeribacter sp.]|uniref:hypothetical protein n=1 Tax=Celeribacter sp. TaxID=1890673 RepID=UPI003A938E5D